MLTQEQQHIIEESLWVVNAALKQQGLSRDQDLRQSALLYMCICLERFDPTINIKWTTYAYKNVYLYIKRKHYADLKTSNRETGFDYLAERACETEWDILDKVLVSEVMQNCTGEERAILRLKMNGYTHAEIGKKLGCSVWTVNRKVADIKKKVRLKNDPP